MILEFITGNAQVVMLVLISIMTLLMILWSGMPVLLWMIYRKLKSIEKVLKNQQKT